MTTSKSQFFIDSTVLVPGNELDIQVNQDNAKCKSGVKSFKFKLFRKISYDLPNGQKVETGEYIKEVKKVQGFKAKE